MNEQIKIMETAPDGTLQNFFAGSVPRNYDTYMGPVLFTPYAMDLVARIKTSHTAKVLELAAGTGRATRHLIDALSQAEIIATDISDDMMAVAKETIRAPHLSWQNADMAAIPFADSAFDLVICQFGLMFVPDKPKALSEIRRVLKPGGQFLFNTWGNIDENPMWKMGFSCLNTFIGASPFPKELGPFGLPEEAPVLAMLDAAGFINSKAEQARIISELPTAAAAAESFLLTSPALAKQPDLFPKIHKALTNELKQSLGDQPIKIPLLALVFEAVR